MCEELRAFRGDLLQEDSRPRLACMEPLVLPPRPGNQRFVDIPVERSQSRRLEPPVISNPSTEDWIEFRGDVLKAEVRAITVVQAARLLAHRGKSRRADRRRKAGKQVACLAGLHAAAPELIPKDTSVRQLIEEIQLVRDGGLKILQSFIVKQLIQRYFLEKGEAENL